ncbi:phosphoglucomutase/phosphomannomutase family protein [Anaerosoma tenue]|uniref:phosphoglucomutase/phosphomannomutase family protein n=1 Tax=Anaerosoma tenue TaxID=2933588 RepID=UPI002260A19C|nr:phosphoglucomutase/phosphomannomutase family protein [Anaerosoma tenue]MCK8114681.1 phosphoglucomutase/phosphomannomutase family protein [Anaerosoma tenue]
MTSDIRFGTDGWRAVIGAGFTYDNLRRVADAAGRVYAAENPGGLVLVGYDTRFEAESFARAAAEVLASHGLRVGLSDRYLPTPALCWAVAHDEAAIGGVMLTASHNPAPYLGFKLRMADGGASPKSFSDRVEAALAAEPPAAPADADDLVETVDLMGPYLDALRAMVDAEVIAEAGLRVVVDPLYGAGQTYLAETLRGLGVEVTELHGERNPGFGGLHPEPIPPHIVEAQEYVREHGLDAAFITDGDADRIGAADRNGTFVNPHRIIALVARHLVEGRGMSGRIVKTLSTSVLVDRIARHLGSEVTTTPVGFKWIYEEMLKGDVLIGGEESGGIGIPSHVRERDGLLMALLLVEMMARHEKGLGALVDDLLETVGAMEYGRFDMRLEPAAMSRFVEAMPTLAPTTLAGMEVLEVIRTDGVKFLLPDDAWLLLRASGTEPLVRVYAEAADFKLVDELLAAGRLLANDA